MSARPLENAKDIAIVNVIFFLIFCFNEALMGFVSRLPDPKIGPYTLFESVSTP
jgi:hypothetical protein